MKRTTLSLAVSGAIAVSTLATAGQVFAQDDENVIEEMTVTGSRIQRADLESVSPMAIVSGEEFQISAILNVEQKLNELPVVTPNFGASSNNPGDGTARVDLRGLGSFRTLVLVNGRRYIPSTQTGAVDLNSIPAALIEQVDVLTGGASAVYGSDALAGVVNFTLKDDFEGVELGLLYDVTADGDGEKTSFDVTMGGNFDDGRGNAVVFLSYAERDAVFQGDRDFSNVALTESGDELVPGGSSGVPGTRLFGSPGGFFAEGGSLQPWVEPDSRFNYAPDNYLQLPQERFLMSAFANYDLTEDIKAYTEIAFSHNEVPQELAPTPAFTTVEINPDSPFFDAATQAALGDARSDTNGDGVVDGDDNFVGFIGRRMVENGSRQVQNDRDAFRILLGAEGDITESWGFDTYYSKTRLTTNEFLKNDVSASRFVEGVAVTDDGTACQSGNPSCVPINIFGPGTLTDEMIDYLKVNATNSTFIEQEVIHGSLFGSIVTLPSSEEPIGLVVGFEHRIDDSEFTPDTFLSTGDVLGFNAGEATVGSYSSSEFFAEVNVPIIQGAVGAENLSLWAAYRASDYSNIGNVDSYALAVNYAPSEIVSFRVGLQEAVRAPNIDELFGGQSQGFPGAVDPCSVDGFDASVDEALCISTGVDAANVGNFTQANSQIEGLFGGNPDLGEETGTTFTAGIVLQPMDGLDITLDYYEIEIEDAIDVLGGGVQNVLDLCYRTVQDAGSTECQAITRRADGNVDFVSVLNENIGKIETSGIDLTVNYTMDMDAGFNGNGSSLSFSFFGTFLDAYDETPLASLPSEVNECAGSFGNVCGEPLSDIKWNLRTTWNSGPLTLSGLIRYIGSTEDDLITVGGFSSSDLVVSEIDEEYYLDLSASYTFGDNFDTTLVLRNVFDTEPTALGGSQDQANTFPSTYDLLGPWVAFTARYRFD